MLNTTSILLAASDPLDHVVQHKIFAIPLGAYELVFTNHMLMMIVAAVIMLLVFPRIAARKGIVPTGFRNLFESICVYLRDEMARPILGAKTDAFIPYIWNIFFFILFMNLLGMIPIDGILKLVSLGHIQGHFGGTSTGNIWVTGGLAVLSFLMIHVNGIREQGAMPYIKNFIPHVPLLLVLPMYVLELVSSLIKPCALAIRLFANMVAGHTILAAFVALGVASGSFLYGGVAVIASTLFSLLELLVAFVQAYIFTFLTVMFMGAAMHPEH
jgi:F-type H+-transporting ATPase subunit a